MSIDERRRDRRERTARNVLATRRAELALLLARERKEVEVFYDDHPADWRDRATSVASAQDLEALSEQLRRQLAEVDAALLRIDSGRWGTCDHCGGSIAEGRLVALPDAAECQRCIGRSRATH